MNRVAAGYDLLAWQYGFWEAMMFGRGLQSARQAHWNDGLNLIEPKSAWCLGDGTGHMTRRILEDTRADLFAIDISQRMLNRQEEVAHGLGFSHRWSSTTSDIHQLASESIEQPAMQQNQKPDLIVAAFLLDCFTETQLERWLGWVVDVCQPSVAFYVVDFVSDQDVPLRFRKTHQFRLWMMHCAFGLWTHHPTKELVDWRSVMERAGWHCVAGGLHEQTGTHSGWWRLV